MSDQPIGPDWKELAALLAPSASPPDGSDARSVWLRIIWSICQIQILRMHCVGNAFEDNVKLATGYNKTTTYKIVKSGIADHLSEIWRVVHTDAHATELQGKAYLYPRLSTMIGWYTEPNLTPTPDME